MATEEERAQAKSVYNPAYEAALDQLTASELSLGTAYERNKQTINDTTLKNLETTQKNIEASLLRRGMGRSDQAANEITTGLADVNTAGQKSIAQLLEDYNTNLANINTQRGTLTANYNENVMAKLLEIEQFNRQMALQERELELAYRRSGSGSSSGTSAEDVYGSSSSAAYAPAGSVPSALGGNVPLPAYRQSTTGGNSLPYPTMPVRNQPRWVGSLGGRNIA